MNKIILLIVFVFGCSLLQAQVLSKEELKKKPVFTSLEEALLNPEQVYRLQLKGQKGYDSLPEALFSLYNLNELTVTKCRLLKLNSNISRLENLQYLNLSSNRLVFLPESLCDLTELRTLIISRNMLEALPDNIGKLQNLDYIDAWDNRIATFPESISQLAETLKIIDLRQIPLKSYELEAMEKLLPKTDIKITSVCDCKVER